MQIKVNINNHSYYHKVQIVSVSSGYSKKLKDGQWVNMTKEPETFEDEILSIGKCFNNYEDAKKFIETKAFKALVKLTQKGGL